MRWWHEALVDYMLANPSATQKVIAQHFKKSEGHISVLVNTDMFKAYFAHRRSQLNSALADSVQRKLLGTLDLTLDVMKESLENKRGQIPFKDTSTFVNSTLERLGYGSSKPNGVAVTINAASEVRISASDLQEARELLRRSEAAKLIDSTPIAQPLVEAPKSDAA